MAKIKKTKHIDKYADELGAEFMHLFDPLIDHYPYINIYIQVCHNTKIHIEIEIQKEDYWRNNIEVYEVIHACLTRINAVYNNALTIVSFKANKISHYQLKASIINHGMVFERACKFIHWNMKDDTIRSWRSK